MSRATKPSVGAQEVIISVIIPSLNEQAMIGKSLTSLAIANAANTSFEVIVVDNGSTDRTLEIAESFADRLTIQTVQKAGVHVSALRNIGARMSRGKVLAFLDADCVVPTDWLLNARREFCDDSAGVVGGYIRIPDDSTWVSQAWYGFGYAPKTGDVDYVPSGNLLMRRADFVAIGGFDERLETTEDFDLCLRARQASLSVRAVSDLAVIHLRTPRTPREFYNRERWHGAHVAKALRGNIAQWKSFRAIAFALFTFLCLVGAVGGAVFGLATGNLRPFLGFICTMLAGSVFCTVAKCKSARKSVSVGIFLQLTSLHIIYGMARAQALLSLSSSYHRSLTLQAIEVPAERS